MTCFIKIGCQFHSVKNWKRFTDEEISRMDEHALDFWRANKDMLIGIHDKMSEQAKKDGEKCETI